MQIWEGAVGKKRYANSGREWGLANVCKWWERVSKGGRGRRANISEPERRGVGRRGLACLSVKFI